MKRSVIYSLITASLLIFILSCGENSESQITWSQVEFIETQYSTDIDDISVSYLRAADVQIADKINGHIDSYLTGSLGLPGSSSPEAAIDSILKQKNSDAVISHIPYVIHIDCESYSRKKMISILIETYIFTGGAHGNSVYEVLNIDMKTGELLTIEEIITDLKELEKINREEFVANFGSNTDYTKALFVKPEELPLPDNIVFTEDFMILYYDEYQIAPYYYGIIENQIPIEKVKHLLTY